MAQIFVSYSRSNTSFAERLARDLQDAGIDVWIDFRSIKGGEEFADVIFRGIRESDMFIVCLSPAAVDSEWVRREIVVTQADDIELHLNLDAEVTFTAQADQLAIIVGSYQDLTSGAYTLIIETTSE